MENEAFEISGNQSLTKNPFTIDNASDQASFKTFTLTDLAGPSSALASEDDFFMRESLGILPGTTLVRDSLTRDFFSKNIDDQLLQSPRESFGILNLSAMDLGRESMGIFSINNPMFHGDYSNNEKKANLELTDVFAVPLDKDKSVPQILLSGTEEGLSLSTSEFNKGFLFPNSRKISEISSKSSGTSISWCLEDYFKIPSVSPILANAEESGPLSMSGTTDPLNVAFQLSLNNQTHLISSKSASHQSFASELENIRNRIQSLPATLENNNLGRGNIAKEAANVSFDQDLVFRGVREETEFNDSVFLADNKQLNGDNCDDKPFDAERYLLDCTPQPEWDDCNSSKSINEKSPLPTKEGILKKVDKMFGMQPASLENKIKLKTVDKCDTSDNKCDTSSVNISQNISKISRGSQCSIPEVNSNNFSQELSKISQTSEQNVSRLIKNLSDILSEKENLSKSQKNDAHHMLHCLADMLGDNNRVCNSEDSGHSSVESPHVAEKVEDLQSDVSVEKALDLSCKNRSICNSSNANNSAIQSPINRNPPPYVSQSPSHTALLNNMSKNSTGSNASNASQSNSKLSNNSQANASKHATPTKNGSFASFRRHTMAQNRFSGGMDKLKDTKTGFSATKREPLRALLPVETMAKGAKSVIKSLQEKSTDEINSKSKCQKTSTPIKVPKLKPMASSTPSVRQTKQNTGSVLVKPKLMRSMSHQPRISTADQISGGKCGAKAPTSKTESTKVIRRNSVSESVTCRMVASDSGSPRQRSSSIGKEPKFLSALSRVRQNILNSPYYRGSLDGNEKNSAAAPGSGGITGNNLKSCNMELKSLSRISQPKRFIGKENLKP